MFNPIIILSVLVHSEIVIEFTGNLKFLRLDKKTMLF